MRKQNKINKTHLLMVGLLTTTALCFVADPAQAASSYGSNGTSRSDGSYTSNGGSSSTSTSSTSSGGASTSGGGSPENVGNTVGTTNPVSLDSNGKPVISPIFIDSDGDGKGEFVATLKQDELDAFMARNGKSMPVCPPTYSGGGGGGGDGDSGGGGYKDTDGDGRGDTYVGDGCSECSSSRGATVYEGSNYSGSNDGGSAGDNGGGGSMSGSKVICTWFYQRGELDEILYFADIESAKHIINPITVRGYHAWGISYVKHLRKNPDGLAAKIIRPVVMHRAREIGYQMGVREKGDWLGKAFRVILEPMCFVIGVFVPQNNWRTLYNASDFRAFAEGYRRYQTFKADLVSI